MKFKLFNKQAEPIVNMIGKTQNQIVEQIHAEFDSAEDRLLQQAQVILNGLTPIDEIEIEAKAVRLQRIGFVNAATVKQASKITLEREIITGKIIKTQADVELILRYKINYPTLKFLTEDELDRICQKWGLIYAPVKNFIKDVPDKNIKDIEIAPVLQYQDIQHPIITVKVTEFWRDLPQEIKTFLKKEIPYVGYVNAEGKPSESDLLNCIKKFIQTDYKGYIFKEAIVKTIRRDGLFICAPQQDFDLTNLTKEGKFGNFEVTHHIVNDPVVFRYCRGGVQVLSKWGLEATDDLLLNPIEN